MASYEGKAINPNLRLALDSRGMRSIKESEVIPLNSRTYHLTVLPVAELAGVVEFVDGKLQEKQYKKVGNQLVFSTQTSNPTLALSMSALNCAYTAIGFCTPVKLYVVGKPQFEYRSIRLKSINWLTGLEGKGLFSLNGKTLWVSDLVLPDDTSVVYYKHKATKKGQFLSDVITMTYTTYLGV